ncbi:MAG: translocation/assembly module TamB domain-containing protein [Alphaproteobacteria bacterium]|nr:translocation/assembly module TamB domain-containing protein [Alphaproteobacteria bacterium]
MNGTLVDDVLSFSGNIKNKNTELKLKNCIINLKDRSYQILLEVIGNKKTGTLQLLASANKIYVVAQNMSVQDLGKAFGKILPQCLINGSFESAPSQDCFAGKGYFKVEELISRQSKIDINLKQDREGLSVQGNLSNAVDNLRLEALVPVLIKRDLDFLIKKDSSIKISIKGNAHIENIFEFPDGITVKGKVKSDLNIIGKIDSPQIRGNIECSDTAVIIADVVLKNGMIKLSGRDNKFVVYDSYFVDSYGKKATINGDAVLFFSDNIPNLDTDLQLGFDNFRLFDTDSMKINILGNGKMEGPIDNLKLSGNLKVPLCELIFLESGDDDQYKDITVMNDVFLSKTKKEEDDFFLYDINLEGQQIKILGNIYKLDFAGNLHLGTYNKKATLSGSIDLKEGRLNLFGKRMIFEKSKIKFFEQYPFDPKMKISCSRDIDSMKVVLDVKNIPGEEMSLDLHSHPNYTQDVILSHMMFGKSSKDLSVGEAAQLAHAVNSINKKGYIFSVLNAFQNIGLVDSLSFSSDSKSSSLYKNSQTSSDKINVRAGKYLSDNVYISVNKKGEETSFDVDLSVGSHTSLKVNTLGEVGVNWKFRY